MNDETYVFIQDVRERKVTARGAYHKVSGSRSKKCTLSQDTLTPAQLKRRNGPVLTYDMSKPHTWKELKHWPHDMRKEYLTKLLSTYTPSNTDLADMLDVSPGTVTVIVRDAGISRTRGGNRRHGHNDAWHKFIHIEPDPVPETPAPKLAPISYDTITLSFTGTTTDLIQSILTGPIHLVGSDVCTFTITAHKKGE